MSDERIRSSQTAPNRAFALVAIALVAVGMLLTGSLWAQDDERAKLLAEPKYVDLDPDFKQLTADELAAAIKVVANRNYAVYGFNTPEIQLYLPLLDNSTYAKIDMPEPKLVDAAGKAVAYELERGLHDAESQTVEIRFLADDGQSPAAFAKAVGQISISYPLDIETSSVEAGRADQAVSIDGPFALIDMEGVPEAAPFSPLQPVRAYDSQGRQLEKSMSQSSQYVDGRQLTRMPFHGQIARLEVDRIVRSVDVEVLYEVPISEALPARRQGVAPADQRALVVDPRSRIDIDLGSTMAQASGGAAGLPPAAQQLAQALEALDAEIDEPIKVVQLMVTPPSLVGVSSDSAAGVREWIWSDGTISGPTDVDTQWLQCKSGMDEEALDLQRLPAIWSDALSRTSSGDSVLQIVVGQYPCGTPNISVMMNSGSHFQYRGDGKLLK